MSFSLFLFYGFKYVLADFGWVYDGICFFQADVKCAFCGGYIVGDSNDGSVFNATIIDRNFVITGEDVWIGVDVCRCYFSCFNVT